jgi:hypothetical protein
MDVVADVSVRIDTKGCVAYAWWNALPADCFEAYSVHMVQNSALMSEEGFGIAEDTAVNTIAFRFAVVHLFFFF